MDRRNFLRTATTLGVSTIGAFEAVASHASSPAGTASGNSDATKSEPHGEAARRIERAAAAALAMQRRDWEQGILAQAFLETNDRERVILLTKAAIIQRTPDGRLGVVQSGSPTDPAMGGEAYAKAAEWTGDPQIQQALNGLLEWIRVKAPRNSVGVLYHLSKAPEMWSDGFNAAPPFLAAMGFYEEALAQIDGFRLRLWNPERKLLAHIWDDGKEQFRDGNFWGGGNGWAAAGLVRVIRSLPRERRRDRNRLAAFVREIVDGCLKYQRDDGLFHDVVDQPSTFVETNLAQMLAFAIYEGIAGGWLASSYRIHADRMRTAARGKMDTYGYVQGVCGAPMFNSPGLSAEGQAFCIMMEFSGRKVETLQPA
jgi:rhamnogalacturonyl hydrolase YesR